MNRSLDNLHITLATPDDSHQLADLFHAAVHSIDPAAYSPEEQEVWAPTPPDYRFWQTRMQTADQRQTFIAITAGKIIAFMEYLPLDTTEAERLINTKQQPTSAYIDCTYTHPDYQGQGIASLLYNQLEAHAQKQKTKFLKVDVSKTAETFFLRRGFIPGQQNFIERNGQTLSNRSMLKTLPS